jgi:hypothetical protein
MGAALMIKRPLRGIASAARGVALRAQQQQRAQWSDRQRRQAQPAPQLRGGR